MNLSPLPIQKFFDNAGRPLNGGLLFTYVAGTSTKLATYTDSSGGTPNTNPVVLNFRGEANVWLDQTLTYKFVLAPEGDTDPPTRPIWSVDNISAAVTYASLTQQILGLIIYPRSAAETAAAVTPIHYVYPYGNLKRYGAALDGVTDDAASVASALAQAGQSGGAAVFHPGGTCLINSAQTIPANVLIYGIGKTTSILKKNFNGDLFAWGSNSGFRDVGIDGNKASRTGRSATIAAGSVEQYADNCQWINSDGYAVEYLGQDPGSNSYFMSCDFNPTNVANGVCIKYSGTTDSQAVPRSIINCHGGGAYIVDFGAANDSFFIGNFTNGMIWSSANVSHVFVAGNRIALNGATLTVKGSEAIFVGNSVAGPVTFDNTTVSCMFSGTNPGSGWSSITDNGTSNYIDIKQVGAPTYVPVFSSGGGGAAIGNGTIVGQFTRFGNTVFVDIDFQPGGTTAFGAGAFQFSLPIAPGAGGQFVVGHAQLFDASANTYYTAAVTSNPALSLVTLTPNAAVGNVAAAVPFAWANGDRLILHVQYQTA